MLNICSTKHILKKNLIQKNHSLLGKQATDAGVSLQCLEYKMSKGAKNVGIGQFYITRPPKRVQIWVT